MATATATIVKPEIFKPPNSEEWDEETWEAYHYHPYDTDDEDPDDPAFQKYESVIAETQGYIIPEVPEHVKLSGWRPTPAETTFHEVVDCSKLALGWYMDKQNCKGKYEFLEVKHANSSVACGTIYRLVFTARDVATGHHVLFKAEVLAGIKKDDNTVYVCQPAPELEHYI